MITKYFSKVEKGKLQPNITKQILETLSKYEGKRVQITIEKEKISRTEQQNKYYWVIVDILRKEIGLSKDEMHDILKYKFLTREKVLEDTGEVLTYCRSTASLTKEEFIEYIDSIVAWAALSLDCIIPAPNEQVTFEIT